MRFIGKPFSIPGHTSRKGFWRFLFFYAVVVTVLALAPFPNGLLVNTSALALTLLLLLAGWRRLRDAGMSGWLVLLPLVPVAGALALIGLLARPATGGTGDAPETSKSIVRGALQGWLEIARFCGAVLGYLILFIRWMGRRWTARSPNSAAGAIAGCTRQALSTATGASWTFAGRRMNREMGQPEDGTKLLATRNPEATGPR